MLKNWLAKIFIRTTSEITTFNRVNRLRKELSQSLSSEETVKLFGKYKLKINLSMGNLQKTFFLFPDHYETETRTMMRKLLRPGMTVFDVGAQVGFFTIFLADLVGKQGKVFSFEPYTPNFNLLKQNVEHNHLNWVTCSQIACSNQEGSAVLSINPINDGGHSLGDFKNNPDVAGMSEDELPKVTVKTATLDSFVQKNNIDHIDFLKIDVEGAETLVLEGAKDILSSPDAPMIICEVGEKSQEQLGKTEKDLRQMFYSYGYQSHFITGGELTEFGIDTPVEGLPNILFKKK